MSISVSRSSIVGVMDREYIQHLYNIEDLIAPGVSGFFKRGSYF